MELAPHETSSNLEHRANSRRTYKNGRQQRQKILDTALVLFGCKGFSGTSMREIAAAVGISQPGLLHHFPNKELLLRSILKQRQEEYDSHYYKYIELPWQEAVLMRFKEDLTKRPMQKFWSLCVSEASDPNHPLHDYFVDYRNYVRDQIALRIAYSEKRKTPTNEDFSKAALTLVVWEGLKDQWLLDENFEVVAIFEYFIMMISRYSQYKFD